MKFKKIVVIALAVVFLTTLAACSTTTTVNINSKNNTNNESTQSINASLMLDFGNGTVKVFKAAVTDHTVFGLTKKATEDNNLTFAYDPPGEWGVFIKEIGGQANTTDKYWQFWVNNQFGDRAADQYSISEGAVVEWKFIKSQL